MLCAASDNHKDAFRAAVFDSESLEVSRLGSRPTARALVVGLMSGAVESRRLRSRRRRVGGGSGANCVSAASMSVSLSRCRCVGCSAGGEDRSAGRTLACTAAAGRERRRGVAPLRSRRRPLPGTSGDLRVAPILACHLLPEIAEAKSFSAAADPEPLREIGLAFQERTGGQHIPSDAMVIRFAAHVVEKMREPKESFPLMGATGRTYYPSGPYGRLDEPFNYLARGTVDRRVRYLMRRGLITEDPWGLATEGRADLGSGHGRLSLTRSVVDSAQAAPSAPSSWVRRDRPYGSATRSAGLCSKMCRRARRTLAARLRTWPSAKRSAKQKSPRERGLPERERRDSNPRPPA